MMDDSEVIMAAALGLSVGASLFILAMWWG